MAEVSWTVIHVRATDDDPPEFDSFAYSEGLVANENVPNLWVSYRGDCGHQLGYEMAHYLVNGTARRLIAGEIAIGESWDSETAAGGVVRVRLGETVGRDECARLEAFPRDGVPLSPLSWTCSLDDDWVT